VRLTPLGREAVQGNEHAALRLRDLGQAPALLLLVAGPPGSRVVRRARAPMGCREGESCGDGGVNLAGGRALGLPQPAHVHEAIIAIRGAGRRQALSRG
jgi:hypothetical protein